MSDQDYTVKELQEVLKLYKEKTGKNIGVLTGRSKSELMRKIDKYGLSSMLKDNKKKKIRKLKKTEKVEPEEKKKKPKEKKEEAEESEGDESSGDDDEDELEYELTPEEKSKADAFIEYVISKVYAGRPSPPPLQPTAQMIQQMVQQAMSSAKPIVDITRQPVQPMEHK